MFFSGKFKIKNKLRFILVASLLFGASGFNYVLAQDTNLNPDLDCSLQLNQVSYTSDDTVIVEAFRIANLDSTQVAAGLKIWLGLPDASPLPVTNRGSDGSFIL